MGTGGILKDALYAPVLRRLEVACLALAAMAAVAHLCGLLLVIGGTVLAFWAVSGIMLAVSVVLRVVSWRAARRTAAPPIAARVRLLRSILSCGVVLVCMGAAFVDLSASYRLLEPPGRNGCRAVVREHSFLFAGGGTVYGVGFGGIGTRASSWTTDDGYEPVADGSYTLRWDGDTGVLSLVGGVDPVWPAVHTIPCS